VKTIGFRCSSASTCRVNLWLAMFVVLPAVFVLPVLFVAIPSAETSLKRGGRKSQGTPCEAGVFGSLGAVP
jgi:hypothetical protein